MVSRFDFTLNLQRDRQRPRYARKNRCFMEFAIAFNLMKSELMIVNIAS